MFTFNCFKTLRISGALALVVALSAQNAAVAGPDPTFITSADRSATQVVEPTDLVRIRHISLPEYSNDLVRKGIQGVIEVQAHIDADGHVTEALVTHAEPQTLTQVEKSVLDSVRSATFYPSFEDGKATDSYVMIPFRFELVDRTVSTFPFKRVAKSRLARSN